MELQITLQPKQREALRVSEITPVTFYGGSKGGGKSHLVRARELIRRMKYPNTKGLIIRKTHPELLSNHIRKFFIEYPETRGWYNKSEKAIYYPNGSITEFSYLGSTDDVYTYQGREYEDISIDEVTQHEEEVIKVLRSSLRSSNKEFTSVAMPTMFLTGNPGGIGHYFVKRLFVDKQFTEKEKPTDYAFIQAFVQDNRALLDADPEYVNRLLDMPDDKVRAYLYGDWDVFSGQVFSEFSIRTHGIDSFIPMKGLDIYLSMDWGYSEKSAFAAFAHVVVEQKSVTGEKFNRIFTFHEWHGNQKTPQEWAEIIANYMKSIDRKFVMGYADPAMFNTQTDGSVPISELMTRHWESMKFDCPLYKGNNNRVNKVATMHNWMSVASDGLPYWLMTKDCVNAFRTIPMLVYDDKNVDDIDTTMDDHDYDSITYFQTMIRFTRVKAGNIRQSSKSVIPFNAKGQSMSIDPQSFFVKNKKHKSWEEF